MEYNNYIKIIFIFQKKLEIDIIYCNFYATKCSNFSNPSKNNPYHSTTPQKPISAPAHPIGVFQ